MKIYTLLYIPGGSDGKESACNAGDPGSIPGLERSPGEGNGNPLQCSCLDNPRDGGAWWAAVYRVAQSWTRLKRLSSSSIFLQNLWFQGPDPSAWTHCRGTVSSYSRQDYAINC